MLPRSGGLAVRVRLYMHSLDLRNCGRHCALSMNFPYSTSFFLEFRCHDLVLKYEVGVPLVLPSPSQSIPA